jgi:hypothetical protein
MNAKTNKQQQEEYKIMAMMMKVIVEKVVTEQLKPIKKQLAEIRQQAAKQAPIVERSSRAISGLKRSLSQAGYGQTGRPMRRLSNDPVLNRVLNETQPGFDGDDPEEMTGNGLADSMMLDEDYGQRRPMRRPQVQVPTTGPDGEALNLSRVPRAVLEALNRDYREDLQELEQKSKEFRRAAAGGYAPGSPTQGEW